MPAEKDPESRKESETRPDQSAGFERTTVAAKAERGGARESPEQHEATLEQIRERIENAETGRDDLIERMRFDRRHRFKPVRLSAEQAETVSTVVAATRTELDKNYMPGFGVSPSSGPKENYFEQIWTRDFAHAAGNYFIAANPQATAESLAAIFRNQRADGALPYRVDKRYPLLQIIPKIGPFLAKKFFERRRGKNRPERPCYEGEEFSGAEDTVPASLIAAGEFFVNSGPGREFAAKNFEKFKKAVEYFKNTKVDPEDGLASTKNANPDWEDSLYRKGKLGNINIWWARGLRLMEYAARQLGENKQADEYKAEFQKAKQGILEKIYNREAGYFRAKAGEDRLDTTASIFGALYFLSPEECARLEDTLEQRVRHASGLKNFDPPYDRKEIFWIHKVFNHEGYHNEFVWPWVDCENIQVKIKIALGHSDPEVRARFQKEAVGDFVRISELFKQAGGAYEIFHPDRPEPAATKTLGIVTYTPIKNLMGGLAAYQAAYGQLRKLGWIDSNQLADVAG